MTKKIRAKTTLRALDAVAFMNSNRGVAFNGMITINFEQLGLSSATQATCAMTKLNEALADKIRRYGQRWKYTLPHYYLYVHEHVESWGHHAHQLVVVPRGLNAGLDRWLKKWAQENFGRDAQLDAIQYGGEYPKDTENRAALQARMVRYIFKSSEDRCVRAPDGSATTLHDVLEAHRHRRAYCAAAPRVVGMSQNINIRERLRAGFWGYTSPACVFTEEPLRDWARAVAREELNRSLLALDV